MLLGNKINVTIATKPHEIQFLLRTISVSHKTGIIHSLIPQELDYQHHCTHGEILCIRNGCFDDDNSGVICGGK